MLKKFLVVTVLFAGILAPVSTHAENEPYDPMTITSSTAAVSTSNWEPVSPFASVAPLENEPYDPMATIFPPTE